jgi:hypothetical protein
LSIVIEVHIIAGAAATAWLIWASGAATAQDRPTNERLHEVEGVDRIHNGHQNEGWTIFQGYQIAIFDREKQLR